MRTSHGRGAWHPTGDCLARNLSLAEPRADRAVGPGPAHALSGGDRFGADGDRVADPGDSFSQFLCSGRTTDKRSLRRRTACWRGRIAVGRCEPDLALANAGQQYVAASAGPRLLLSV